MMETVFLAAMVFHLTVAFPGERPVEFEREVENISECLDLVREALAMPLPLNSNIETGCNYQSRVIQIARPKPTPLPLPPSQPPPSKRPGKRSK